MRVCTGLFIVVAFVACKKKEPASPAAGSGGAGSGASDAAGAVAVVADAAAAADAAVALEKMCIDEDDRDANFNVVASDDHSVTACFQRNEGFSAVTGAQAPARTKCARVDFSSGTVSAVPPLAAPEPPPEAKPYDTSKLQLPKAGDGGGFTGALSPDGKLVALTSGSYEAKLFIYDAATGKHKKVVTWADADGGCMEEPKWVGENIYVQYNVCAGPGATGWIVSPTGKKLGQVGGVNPTNTFFPVGANFAFEDFGGSSVTIVDGKSGKVLKTLELTHCDECPSFGPQALDLVPIGGGKLVQFGEQVALIDPVGMKIEKQVKWTTCPEPKK